MYDEYRDDPEEFKYEDDEDSNDEDNERNEYPDEDDEESSYQGYCDDGDLDLEMRVKGLVIEYHWSHLIKSDLSKVLACAQKMGLS